MLKNKIEPQYNKILRSVSHLLAAEKHSQENYLTDLKSSTVGQALVASPFEDKIFKRIIIHLRFYLIGFAVRVIPGRHWAMKVRCTVTTGSHCRNIQNIYFFKTKLYKRQNYLVNNVYTLHKDNVEIKQNNQQSATLHGDNVEMKQYDQECFLFLIIFILDQRVDS